MRSEAKPGGSILYAERSGATERSEAIAPRRVAVVRPMTIASLDGVLDLEVAVYPFP
jgi:hypothetical protein